jgi:hypothetical protein
MNIKKVDSFVFQDGVRIDFSPITDAPPCTHRVYVLKKFVVIAKDWFGPVAGSKTPNKKAAKFYYEKHQALFAEAA